MAMTPSLPGTKSIKRMSSSVKHQLRAIGLLLDQNEYPYIYKGGIVKPGDTTIVPSIPGEESNNVYIRQKRSPAGSRERATGGQRSPGGPGSSDQASQLINSDLRTHYEAELDEVCKAYPGTQSWQQQEGMWLLTESSVLPGLGKKATFLTAVPYSTQYVQQSWGFWTTPINTQWIGPRHTNIPQGSICAFNPNDGTWKLGDSLLDLLAFYTLWALRHEHLKTFGYWPGRQYVPHDYERITELKDHELCGCDTKGLTYANCCKESDLTNPKPRNISAIAQLIHRTPPNDICSFIRYRNTLPQLKSHLIERHRMAS